MPTKKKRPLAHAPTAAKKPLPVAPVVTVTNFVIPNKTDTGKGRLTPLAFAADLPKDLSAVLKDMRMFAKTTTSDVWRTSVQWGSFLICNKQIVACISKEHYGFYTCMTGDGLLLPCLSRDTAKQQITMYIRGEVQETPVRPAPTAAQF